MPESNADRRKAERDRVLAAGGIPLDPYPGYVTWHFRACVESGATSGLDWICRTYPQREIEILEAWCTGAKEQLWAWQEARSRLEDLVARGEVVPAPLARFAIEPSPPPKRGPDPEGSRSVVIEYMVRDLAEGGFDPNEVNAQFGESFPSPGRKDAGTTLRKRRAKARPFVPPAFEPHGGADSASHDARRKLVLEYDWSEPVEAAAALLTSGWPVFALMWEFWPEHREEHLALWHERARSKSWVWDELRALFDHAVYCGWSMPPLLRGFTAIPRPPNPSHRPAKHGRWVRVAAIEARVAQAVRSADAARLFVADAFEVARQRWERPSAPPSSSSSLAAIVDLGFDLDDSTLRRQFNSGREQLKGVIACTPE